MVRIAWRMLAQRPASMIATFVALWFAVAMVTTCGAMLESGLRFHGAVARYAAAPVLIATTDVRVTHGHGEDRDVESWALVGHGRLAESLRSKVGDAHGVRVAIADSATPTRVIAPGGGAAGGEMHPWSSAQLAPFRLAAGSRPVMSHDVVLDRTLAADIGARPGDAVRLVLASGTRTFRVTGIAVPDGRRPGAATVFATDAEARALSTVPVQVIAALPEPGVSVDRLAARVRDAVPAMPESPSGAYARVFVGADRGSVESPAVDQARAVVIPVSSVFGGATLLIAVLVISGTVGLSVRQRHRDIALLRAVAATPRQVRRMVVQEVAAIGLLAGAAGIWPGLWGAGALRDQFVAHGMVPDTFTTRLSWLPTVVAAAAATLIAIAAARIGSLRASRIRPTEALAETAVEQRGLGAVRTLLGLIALAGGITLCIVSASVPGPNAAGVAIGTVFALVAAAALLSPLLIRAAAGTVGRGLRLLGATGRLAAANTAASARQLSPVLSGLVLAVALGGSLWFVQTSMQHVSERQTHDGLVAEYVVQPPGPGVPSGVAAAVRRTDGVVAATGIVRGTLLAGDGDVEPYSAQGVDGPGLARTLDLDVTHGTLADLAPGTVAVDSLTADALDLHVGGGFHGWFGDGARTGLRVAAIYSRGLGFAQFTLPRATLARHAPAPLDDAILVAVAPDRPEVAAALRDRLERLAPDATVMTADAYRVGLAEDVEQNAWTNKVVTGVLLVYVVIAAVNTLFMSALARRREFGVLRLAGATRLQLLRMVRLERVLLLGLALVTGGAIAAGTLIPMVDGLTGSPAPYIPLYGWVAVIGGVVVLGTLAGAVPVRRILATRPVEAIGLRE